MSDTYHRPRRTFPEIADRLEAMAQALKSITDESVKRELLREMRVLIAEADQQVSASRS